MKKIIIPIIILLAIGAIGWFVIPKEQPVDDEVMFGSTQSIENLIRNKPAKERAKIKATEIAKFDHRGKFTVGDIKVEILSLEKIQVGHLHGVEIYARAWKNGKPLGWGKDGSVEIERFRIFNPPILVDDPNGDIVREWTDRDTGELRQRKLREDPIQAIREALVHTIKVSGKENAKVIKGKIGRTTDTFYPDADPESTSVDGLANELGTNLTWSEIRNGTGYQAYDNTNHDIEVMLGEGEAEDRWLQLRRAIIVFDASAIDSGVTITDVTLSIYGYGKKNNIGNNISINIVSSNPSSNTSLTGGDYDSLGTTKFCDTNIDYNSWSTGSYNDFSFNTSGIDYVQTAIESDGIVKLGAREAKYDITGSKPTSNGNNQEDAIVGYTAEEPGTAKDPKLVITYELPSARRIIITQ